jgi:hypothetical protein
MLLGTPDPSCCQNRCHGMPIALLDCTSHITGRDGTLANSPRYLTLLDVSRCQGRHAAKTFTLPKLLRCENRHGA